MVVFLKELLTLFISGLLSFLVFFGALPGAVIAPEATVPVPVEVQGPADVPATVSSSTADNAVSAETPDEVSQSPTSIEEYLEGALLALEEREEDRQSLKALSQGLNDTARSAVVNILCTTQGAGPVNPISASGVVIDPRGVILTNAHVAQYLLLKDFPTPGFVECVARTGSPATASYRLELLFLPPSWVVKNAQKIDDERPTGNGEHDYALLRVVEAVRPDAPSPLPYLPLVSESPLPGVAVLLAGYPAGFLGGTIIAQELYAASSNAVVGDVYTFNANTVDLFSVGGSILAQQGSSGGAVAVANAESDSGAALLGLIVTSSDGASTASRDLRALSTEYILRDFSAERGLTLSEFLALPLANEALRFVSASAPTLSALLIAELTQ